MTEPTCKQCGMALTDWQGNVMVDAPTFIAHRDSKIDKFWLLHKHCTPSPSDSRTHALFELRWLKDEPLRWLAWAVDSTSRSPPECRWSRRALGQLFRLVAMAHPKLGGLGENFRAEVEGDTTADGV